jgi:hypothetical protein
LILESFIPDFIAKALMVIVVPSPAIEIVPL